MKINHEYLALNTAKELAIELKKPLLVNEVQNLLNNQIQEGFQADESYERETVIILFFNLLVAITGQAFEIYKYYNSRQQLLPSKENYCEQILEEFDRQEIQYNSGDAETICQKVVDLVYRSN